MAETKKDIVERYGIRRRFWTQLLDMANEKTPLHSNNSPGPSSYIGTNAGQRGLNFNYVVNEHATSVELYIDRGKEREDENKRIFDDLHSSKSEIEEAFRGKLEWARLDDRRASRIRLMFQTGGYRDESKWPKIQEELTDAMVRLDQAFKPAISKLEK